MNYLKHLVLFGLLNVMAACTQSPAPAVPGGPDSVGGVESYIAKGQVTDTQGNPLAGVEVFADHTALYDTNLFGVSDANGFYRIDVSGIVPSSWRVGAYLEREYNGYTYDFSLHPDNDAVFAGVDGAVRNLQWRLSGETPEGGFYGGLVYFYTGVGIDARYVELTFVPDGPLVDGSAGQSFTTFSADGLSIPDVPIGRYTVTARYVPPGEVPSPLLIRARDVGEYQSSTTADFIPDDLYGVLMEVEVSRP